LERGSLVHVVDPTGYNGMQLYVRPISEVLEEYIGIGRERLNSFLTAEFPVEECPRILATGDAANEIARVAREDRFDLIIMPTHSGIFRQMLLGSTTAKVINDADCPVLTSRHAQTIAPTPLEHREWLCAVGLSSNSERVLRFASQVAAQAHGKVSIIHAVQAGDTDLPIQLDLREEIHSAERQEAKGRIADLQQMVGVEAPVRIAVGQVKEALLETYAMVRDSSFPVLSV